MLTRVYRIESPFGRGMYQREIRMGKNIGKWDCGPMTPIDLIGRQYMGENKLSSEGKCDDKEDFRPGPREDGIKLPGSYDEQRKWHYGFKDLKQLTRWFEDKVSIKEIIDMGLVIRVLDVTRVRHGRCQAVYHSSSIKNTFTIYNAELYKMYHEEEARHKAEILAAKQKEMDEVVARYTAKAATPAKADGYTNLFASLREFAPKPIIIEDSDRVEWGTPVMANLLKMAPKLDASDYDFCFIPPTDNPPPPVDDPVFTIRFGKPDCAYRRPDTYIEQTAVQETPLKYFGIGAKGVSSESIENRNNMW